MRIVDSSWNRFAFRDLGASLPISTSKKSNDFATDTATDMEMALTLLKVGHRIQPPARLTRGDTIKERSRSAALRTPATQKEEPHASAKPKTW